MNGRHLSLLFAAVSIVAVPAAAGEPAHRATVLPEVLQHMDQAYACLQNHSLAEARAHAEVVLVGNEVTFGLMYQGVAPSGRAICQKALHEAMSRWEDELDGDVRFRLVSDPLTANIQVRFRPSVKMHGEDVAGYVNWKRSISGSSGTYHADMQVRTVNIDGTPMPFEAMRHSSMHELGHVLGLDDSEREGDVMGPLDVERPVSAPRAYEVAAVKSLRQQAETYRDDSLAGTR